MYNKAKPVSLESQTFKQIQDLPIIDIPVEENGSMMQSNLNLIVKDKAIFESANGNNIARMMIKVNAQSLGNITVSFKDVLLENNSYCLVYTQDHQIVAGPIYQKSINNNKFTIMNIPASELILEVIYKSKNDFTLKLDEVSFSSLINVKEEKKKKQEHLLSWTCNFGAKSYIDNILFQTRLDCGTPNPNYRDGCKWLGYESQVISEYENYSKLKSVNDVGNTGLNSTRSACMLMLKADDCNLDGFPNDKRFYGKNAVLINIPTTNCYESIIMVSYHDVGASLWDNISKLDDAVVRFNWHYKYGTPYHLFNLDCEDTYSNFEKWRETIDFSEVIDYEGLELFAKNSHDDFGLLKLKCKTFYKEHHLGWTTQNIFDLIEKPNDPHLQGISYVNLSSFSKDVKIMGSRGGSYPRFYFDNFYTNLPYIYTTNDSENSLYNFQAIGYSGCAVFSDNYLGSDNQILYGLIKAGSNANSGYSSLDLFSYFRNGFNTNLGADCPGCDGKNSIWDYFTHHNLDDAFISETIQFNKYYQGGILKSGIDIQDFDWYPSMDNKEKCPSLETPENPCDFNINDYIVKTEANNEVCYTINTIPSSKFPSNKLPKGFRIYHNFGEQRTIDWKSFQSGNDITFPITFCISKCELLDMLSIGREGIEIAIDFYDENGNVYNNTGCDDLIIEYQYPKFCDLFSVDILKTNTDGNCCTYEVELEINFDLELLDDCPDNPNIAKLIDSIYFTTAMEDEPKRLDEMDNINIDLENGIITFEYTKCTGDISNNSSFKFMISNNGTVCEIDEIDIPFCACDCPEDVDDWVIESTVFEEAPCTDNKCHISAELKIPSMVKNCYINYSIENGPKLAFPTSGIINFTPPCINKGETKNIQIKLFKSPTDQNPCIIDKSFECPLISTFEECTPDCPNVGWDRRGPILVNLPYPCNSFCKMNVYYSTRTADCSTQVNYDIQVTRMEIINTDPNNPNACNGCTLTDEILNKIAIREIIWLNEMDFPPAANGPCELNWRVIQASCWTRIPGIPWGTIENPAPEFILVPCEESSCCSIQIEVCNYGQGGKSMRTIGDVLRDGDGCLNSYFYYHDFNTAQLVSSQCNDVCDEWLNELNEIFYAGGKIVYNDDKKIGTISNDINYYIYNNFDDISINFELLYNKEVNIQIVDLIGQPILSSNYSLKIGSNKIDYKYLNLQTGIYIINVYSNSKLEISDKFIIMR